MKVCSQFTKFMKLFCLSFADDLASRLVGSVALERSLVLVEDGMYKAHLHGIQEVHRRYTGDKGTRVSLIIIHVPNGRKVKTLKNTFSKKR